MTDKNLRSLLRLLWLPCLALCIAILFSLLSPPGLPSQIRLTIPNGDPSCANAAALAQDIATLPPDKTTWLCGKLVFLYNEAGVAYLGLDPCPGSQQPLLIFKTRPRELWTYYQFKNPVLKKGPRVITNFGPVDTYLETFTSYLPLNDCSECLANLSYTPTSAPPTPTDTPSGFVFPTAGSVTPKPTATETAPPTPTDTATASPSPTASATPPPTVTGTPPPSATATLPPAESAPEKSKGICPSAPLALLPLLAAALLRRRLSTV